MEVEINQIGEKKKRRGKKKRKKKKKKEKKEREQETGPFRLKADRPRPPRGREVAAPRGKKGGGARQEGMSAQRARR